MNATMNAIFSQFCNDTEMVEGPKVWLKKERLLSQLSKYLGTDISSLTNALAIKNVLFRNNDSEQFKSLILDTEHSNCRICDLICVGKELYMVFDSSPVYAIRIHFGMNGTERLIKRTEKLDIIESEHMKELISHYHQILITGNKRKILNGVVVLADFVLFLFDSTLSIRKYSHDETTQKLELDIMSPTFNPNKVIDLIISETLGKDHPREIQDILLDQNIFPGVGNVIKCEALYQRKIHPNYIMKYDYSESEEYAIQRDGQYFLSRSHINSLVTAVKTFTWEWYHASKRNRDVYKSVYNSSICGVCHDSIRLIRSGITQRITYYCNQCQYISNEIMQVTDSTIALNNKENHSNRDSVDWICDFCHYHNQFINDGEDNIEVTCDICGEKKEIAVKSKRFKGSTIEAESANILPLNVIPALLPVPTCRCKTIAKLSRTRKSGPCQHRLFWGCSKSMRDKTRCNFFHWADGRFPVCLKHPTMKTILRRVLKPGVNNGKYFFSCHGTSQDGKEKCDFFVWAHEHLAGVNINNNSLIPIDIPL